MDHAAIEKRIGELQKRTLRLTIVVVLLGAALGITALRSFSRRVEAAEAPQVLRVKGLIVEDAQGRSRILIGAPVPAVSDRVRQNAPSTSMVFLDEKGHDRFLVGEAVSPTPTFHRIGASYGVTLFDTEGNERGGMGFLSNGSTVSRAAIALDRAGNGSVPGDAWGAIVDDKSGFAGSAVIYAPEIGHGTEAILIGTEGRKAFIRMKDVDHKDRASFLLNEDGSPSFEVFDATGKAGPNLLQSSATASSHEP